MITLNRETIAEIAAAIKELELANKEIAIAINCIGVNVHDADLGRTASGATIEEAREKIKAWHAAERAKKIESLKAQLAKLEAEK